MHVGAQDARQRDDRADRQIDAAGQDDERHPGGEDRGERVLAQDVDEVGGGEERVGGEPPGRRTRRQRHEDRVARQPRGFFMPAPRRERHHALRRSPRALTSSPVGPPVAHHDDPIRHAEHLRQVRRDHQDGEPLAGQPVR